MNYKRGCWVFVLVFLFVLILNSTDVSAIANCYNSSAAPIPICTCEDLNLTRDDLTADYALENNINCINTSVSAHALNYVGSGWEPIGDNSNKFTGTLNGNYSNISNLFINRSTTNYVGLFGYTSNADIKNIGIVEADYNGSDYTGGLIGWSSLSNITNSFVIGNITGADYVGGLIGRFTDYLINNSYTHGIVRTNNETGTSIGGLVGTGVVSDNSYINYSYSTANVTGYYSVGGLVGDIDTSASGDKFIVGKSYATGDIYLIDGSSEGSAGGLIGRVDAWPSGGSVYHAFILESYATGNITGHGVQKGGFVGWLRYNVEIHNSFARGDVNASTSAGGFAGGMESTHPRINNSYSTGFVNAGSNVGGFVGAGTSSCYNVFWDRNSSGKITSDCGGDIILNTSELKNLSTFTDSSMYSLSEPWDFVQNPNNDTNNNNYWHINSSLNDGYPFLVGFGIGLGVDGVSPIVVYEDPTTNTSNLEQTWIVVNVSSADADLDTINVSLYNGSTIVATNISTSSPFYNNYTGLSDGDYYLNATANDTFGNFANIISRNIILDSISPSISLVGPADLFSNDTFDPVNVTFNCSGTDNVELTNISLYITNSSNDSFALNQSTDISGVSDSANWTLDLEKGNYTWGCVLTDVVGKMNTSENRSLILNFSDTTAPTFTAISNRSIGEERAFAFDINATDNYGFSCFSVNDTTNFKINCSGYLENNTQLTVNQHWLNISINDTTGNINSQLMWINVTKVGKINLNLTAPFQNTNVTLHNLYNITANVTCTRDNCDEINVTLNYANVSSIIYEDFENTTSWTTSSSNSDCTYRGLFDGCEANTTSTNDYDFFLDANQYSGTYALRLDDWDTFNYSKGLWKNITPATDCNGVSCEDYAITFYEHNYGLGTNQFCMVWARYSNGSSVDLWRCNDGDSCDDGTTDSSPEAADYVFRTINLTSESIDLTDSEIAIHVGGNISGSADYCFFDEFKIEGIKNSFAISSNLTQQVNLSVNESSQVIWTLNASGSDDDSQSFFAFANRTNDLLVSNTTDTWNLTVSDNSAPAVSISTPTNDLFSSNTGLNINYTATSGTLDSCWYNNDSMLINTTLASCANITSITWSQGQHNVTIYANDTSGNVGEATVNFTIDSINPLISISSPSNASITNNSVLSINYSSSDTNLGSCWYSNDTMLTNTTLASCANITAVIWSEGEHNVTIWANDSAGNLNNSQITFFIDGPLISFINPTPTNASTVINGFVEINLSFTEDKLNETVYNWNGTNYTLFNDSLVLMLNFDNISSIGENDTSIVDHSRYENNASSYNGSLYTPLGKYGGAITFDGVGSYFNVSNHDSLNFDTSDFSINLWFKANSLPAGGSAGQLFAKRVNGLGDYEVQISNTGIITAYIQQNGADLDNFNGGYDITNRIGEWIFLTLNREGTSIKIFVDGVLNATGTSNQNVTSTSDLTFGSDGDGGFSEYFNGSIDEVRIYKRSLSANEIYQLYASNLKKTDINSWEFYINQSFNSTTNLTYENYTYFGAIKDDPGVWNLTLTRDVVVSNASGPTLTINNPTNDIFSNDTGLDILYTVSSSTLDECWYSNDSMLANTTLAGCANVTALTWSEGDHNVTIYANDSNGVTSSLVNFTIDSIYPTISISSPTNGSESINNTLKIYYSVNDTNVDSCWYSNDSMISNVTLSGCANITSVNWSEGEHNVSVWVNDSSGNLNSSSVTFEIDSINPLISIVSPSNNSFTNDTGLNVTFSVSDTNLESCWYSNDSMLGNTTLTGCANITALTWSEGEHNVSVWANDSFGNINGTSITFNIDSSALSISILDPSSNFYTTNSSIHVNYSVSGDNIDSCWYTNDSMTSNTTLAGCANITSVSWGEGQHNVTIYANDSVGTINSGSLTFYVDLSGPNVTLVSPTNNNVDNSVGDANVLFNCSVVDNLNLANVSLYITNSSNSSFILNQTTNISGESTSSNWTLGLSNGNYTWSCLVSDEVGFNNWSVSNFSLVVNSSVDVDSDGLADSNDRLLFNESNVTKSGLTRLNVTVGGNGTFNRSFSDVHQMLFYDDTSLMMNFSHNFTSKTFSLKNVTVTKTSTSLIVNLSGQLGPGINKTLYISDNSFVSLCVKDAEIGVIGEISSGCNDDNETDFTTCIGSLAGVNLSGLECYDEGSVFRIENLQFSGARGTQAASSSGGSSGGSSSSSSSGGGEIFAGDEIEDFSVTFREGVEYPIFIDKEYHTFKIVDLKSDSATLLFYSLESRVDIKLDELVYLDYDRDGYYDLEILLEKVYGDRAKVVFKFINVKIDDVVEQVNQEIEVIEEVDKVVEKKSVFQVVKKVAIDYNLWLYFMLFLAVGFLIYVWYRYKNRLDYH